MVQDGIGVDSKSSLVFHHLRRMCRVWEIMSVIDVDHGDNCKDSDDDEEEEEETNEIYW